jgi:exodeoxyribonuclease VII large subunit
MNDQSSPVYTISQVTTYIKNLIESSVPLNSIYIKGEISNCKKYSSGHLYFTLKDETSQIKCVMWKWKNESLKMVPRDGTAVIARGKITVYERDGQYQMTVEEMQEFGEGNLYIAFEKLKQKLDEEGLFTPGHKKAIPFLPKVVGVVTSSTGAVIRDIINVATRRNSSISIKLYPVAVQGENAGKEIANAIKRINEKNLADVIIVGRGGGSIEDLWAFNEEIVARSIFESVIPIISAVGHETDFTIADFVADMRAPTPSAAAELAFPKKSDLINDINSFVQRLKNAFIHGVGIKRSSLEKILASYVFKRPFDKLNSLRQSLDVYSGRIQKAIEAFYERNQSRISMISARLNALSPLGVIARGYSVTYSSDGKTIVKKTSDVQINDEINILISDGTLNCKVVDISNDNKSKGEV